MMERILPLELVGQEQLEYDLLDEKGDVLYSKGGELTPDLLMKLSYMKLYRIISSPTGNYTKNAILEIEEPEDSAPPSLIKETAREDLLSNTRKILQKAFDDEQIRLKDCVNSTKIIIEEVSTAFEKIECIDQLRIYDEYTYSHNINVSSLSTAVGMLLGLSKKEINELALGAFLHDIGKMKVPKEVLNKPAKLDLKELEIMRRHTSLGYRYIKEKFEIPDRIARVALDHHEKYSGKGYPNGLNSKMINRYAQITCIVDVYDALISDRIYKKGIPGDKVLTIMTSELKDDFNKEIFEKFLILADPEYVPENQMEVAEESNEKS